MPASTSRRNQRLGNGQISAALGKAKSLRKSAENTQDETGDKRKKGGVGEGGQKKIAFSRHDLTRQGPIRNEGNGEETG